MTALFLFALMAGVVTGVFAMLAGVERRGENPARVSARFNLPLLSAFAAVFGIVGYPLARYSGLEPLTQLLIAGASGAGAAAGSLLLIAAWAVPSARRDTPDERYLLQGHFAMVLNPIPGGVAGAGESGTSGAGTVSIEVDGVTRVVPASSLDGTPIPPGTDVVIERVEAGLAIVEPWGQVEQRI
jgi:hypothetical protein